MPSLNALSASVRVERDRTGPCSSSLDTDSSDVSMDRNESTLPLRRGKR